MPTNPDGFRFAGRQQESIHRRLNRLIGPGPAAFFKDACILIEEKLPLETLAHQAAHAMREVESALRTVMLPLDFKPDPRERHKQEVERIIADYEVGEPVRSFWLRLADGTDTFNLPRWAHRNGLESPRNLDEELEDLWSKFQVMMDTLLEAFETRYLKTQETIDSLVRVEQPTERDLKVLRNYVPNNLVCRHRFFSTLRNPNWLLPLKQNGFFHPPDPISSADGVGTSYPLWPQPIYLSEMAQFGGDTVEQVKEIMLEIDTENVAVHHDLAAIALKLPVNFAAEWANKESAWLDKQSRLPEHLLIEDMLAQLTLHLAKGGAVGAAIRLARSLLSLLPEKSGGFHSVSAKIVTWQYTEILGDLVTDLLIVAEEQIFSLLCDLLQSVAEVHALEGAPNREDHSYVWRRTIADGREDRLEDLEDSIVDAVRDAAISIATQTPSKLPRLVGELEGRPWRIFERIALHLLGSFPEAAPTLAFERLTDSDRFCSTTLREEYDFLAHNCFGKLPEEGQNKILTWVKAGPPHLHHILQGLRKFLRRDPTQQELDKEADEWRLERLIPMRECLPPEWKSKVDAWVERFGEPESVTDQLRGAASTWSSTPLDVSQLGAMQVEEVATYLKSWRSTGRFGEPSAAGLAGILRLVVATEPGRFALSASAFLGTNPVYIEGLLDGLRDALENKKSFPWKDVLALCDWVVAQPRDLPIRESCLPGDPPGWRHARGSMLYLLRLGLQPNLGEIPFDLRNELWAALLPLAEDPEPSPDSERQRPGVSDTAPRTAIDTIRGHAFEAVIYYGFWVRRHLAASSKDTSLSRDFTPMPEVRELLDSRLDPKTEPSLGMRALFGVHLLNLFALDFQWAKANVPRIFPREPNLLLVRQTTWDGYVAYSHPVKGVAEVLGDEYRHAAGRLCGGAAHCGSGRQLANHLILLYCWEEIDLGQDSSLDVFYANADDELCALALQHVGLSLERTDLSTAVLNRLKRLWICRLEVAQKSPSQHVAELSEFGWWFASGKLEDSWAMQQLAAVLVTTGKLKAEHKVAHRLGLLCPQMPLQVLECFNQIVGRDREDWSAGRCHQEIETVIKQTAGIDDPQVRKARHNLVNRMAARGFHID